MKKARIFITLVLALFCFNGIASAETGVQKIQKHVDAAIASVQEANGVSVAVIHGNQPSAYATGGVTSNTAIMTGSGVKPWIATMVLIQIFDQGLYSLTDTVSDIMADNPLYMALSDDFRYNKMNPDATVEQLLTHTAGIGDYAPNVGLLLPILDPDTPWTPGLTVLERAHTEDYKPEWIGEYHYSSSGYQLLGAIIEHKGGKSAGLCIDESISSVIGATNTLLAYPGNLVPADAVTGYDDAAIFGLFPPQTFMDFTDVVQLLNPVFEFMAGSAKINWAAGGLWTNAQDHTKLVHELFGQGGSLIHIGEIISGSFLPRPDRNDFYGYGFRKNTIELDKGTYDIIGHGGKAPGYTSYLGFIVGKRISIAILQNTANSYPVNPPGLVIDRDELAKDILNEFNRL